MNDSSTSLPNGTPEKLHKVWFHNVMNIRSCKVIATHTVLIYCLTHNNSVPAATDGQCAVDERTIVLGT